MKPDLHQLSKTLQHLPSLFLEATEYTDEELKHDVRLLYNDENPNVEVIIVDNPIEAQYVVHKTVGKGQIVNFSPTPYFEVIDINGLCTDFTILYSSIDKQIETQVDDIVDGRDFWHRSPDISVLGDYLWREFIFHLMMNTLKTEVDQSMIRLLLSTWGIHTFTNHAIVIRKPIIHQKNNKIHSIKEPALQWKGHHVNVLHNIYFNDKDFEDAINNDLDMPKAVQILWKLVRDEKAVGKIKVIKKIDEVFGLDLLKKEKLLIPKEVQKLVDERETARKNKNFKLADEIRDKIKDLGYQIDDTNEGVKISKIK